MQCWRERPLELWCRSVAPSSPKGPRMDKSIVLDRFVQSRALRVHCAWPRELRRRWAVRSWMRAQVTSASNTSALPRTATTVSRSCSKRGTCKISRGSGLADVRCARSPDAVARGAAEADRRSCVATEQWHTQPASSGAKSSSPPSSRHACSHVARRSRSARPRRESAQARARPCVPSSPLNL
jgi:hypothetical protein